MKLHKVQIRNFRSIKDITLELEQQCRVLVGINESGKSNILRALSLLKDDVQPIKVEDLREALPREDVISEAYIRFIFKFDKQDTDVLFEEIYEDILQFNEDDPFCSFENKKYSVKQIFESIYNESLYITNIIEEKKYFSTWKKEGKLLSNIKKPTKSCPPDFQVTIDSKNYTISEFKFIDIDSVKGIPAEYLEEAKFEDLATYVGSHINDLTKKNLPSCLLWKYSEENILPGSVDIEQFCNNPESCIALKNMFILSGIKNIRQAMDDAKSRGNNQFQNFLNNIAEKATQHFREVWKEYKDVEFSLMLNGTNIVPGIKEKNTLDFQRRSDGFKRFTTFLLMISVNVKTDNLKNTLLLIDEPEIGLHPSGARYLRDELIRIAKTNTVVYSTHSIFMIDSGDISRHYIVKKSAEVTNIEIAKDSNIADEEVIFNALGHSVFSNLREKNIIFEGWKDKKLFLTYIEKTDAATKKIFKEVGICHAKGAKHIKAITPLMELANRECLILSDSDKPAHEQKNQYEKDEGFGTWKTYQDVDSALTAITGEDFVSNKFIAKQVNHAVKDLSLPSFDESEFTNDHDKLKVVEGWMRKNNLTNDNIKVYVTDVKNLIFENLTSKDIEKTYDAFVKGIISSI